MSRKIVADWHQMHKIYTEQNVTLDVIGEMCKCSPCSVSYHFKKLGLPVKVGMFQPFNIDIKRISERYIGGESATSIAKDLNVSVQVVLDRLHATDVEVVNSRVRDLYKNVDENFFSRKDEWSAYTYGLLLSDGCLSNKDAVIITLQESDTPVLASIAEKMGIHSRPKLSLKKSGEGYSPKVAGSISFSHPKLISDLRDLGMKERKSTREVAPECFAFDRHFWRGMVDGDGSLFMCKLKGPVLTLCGSETICNQFLDYCKTLVDGIKSTVRRHKGDLFAVKLTKNKCLPVVRHMYRDNQICLPRKYNKYLEFEEFFKNYQFYKHTVKRTYKNKESQSV